MSSSNGDDDDEKAEGEADAFDDEAERRLSHEDCFMAELSCLCCLFLLVLVNVGCFCLDILPLNDSARQKSIAFIKTVSYHHFSQSRYLV